MNSYEWNGEQWSTVISPDTDRFAELDVPEPEQHYPFDGQQRSVFACLLAALEPGSHAHLAFLITYERYGEHHDRWIEAENRQRQIEGVSAVGLSAEKQLRLLEHRHHETLRFINARLRRLEYDEWMAGKGLASEFVTGVSPTGGKMEDE